MYGFEMMSFNIKDGFLGAQRKDCCCARGGQQMTYDLWLPPSRKPQKPSCADIEQVCLR